MRRLNKRKGSLLVSVLAIFVLISMFALLIYTLSSTNLKQAKRQEENMHAYYLAYSACELSYSALSTKSDNDYTISGGKPSKWEQLLNDFKTKGSSFTNAFKVCLSLNGTISETGYNKVGFEGSSAIKNTLDTLKDAKVLIDVSIVPETTTDGIDSEYKGYLKIEAKAYTGLNSSLKGENTKRLFVDPKVKSRFYWR